MKQLLINDKPTTTYFNNDHIYNDITIFEEEQPVKPQANSPFTSSW